MSNTPRQLTRNQLAEFLPNARAIRAFEQMLDQVGNLLPSEVTLIYAAIDDAYNEATSGSAAAQSALDTLQQIARTLDTLAQAPARREDTFLRGDYIDLPVNGPHVTQERRIQWNTDDGTIDVGLFNGVVLQVGQETHFYVNNTSGSTILNGHSVMATGALGASGKITCGLAIADGSVSGEYMLGVATQDIANNAFGYVTSFGNVRGIDTSGTPYGEIWVDGDLLYFNPSIPGGLSKVEPASPKLRAPVAIVINAASGGSGTIFVRMKTGEDLAHLHDVTITAPATGHLLRYDATTPAWKNVAASTIAEPPITAGTTAQYWRGDKTWQDFAASARASVLTGLSTATNAVITAADTVLSAFGKLQKQISDNLTTLTTHTGDTANPHATTKAQVGLSNVTNDAQLKIASNLSDVASAATSRSNLGAQATLVSGTNIKTVNGSSLLGAGDVGTIDVAHGGTGLATMTANQVLIGNGTGAVQQTAYLVSDPATGVTSMLDAQTSRRVYTARGTTASLATSGQQDIATLANYSTCLVSARGGSNSGTYAQAIVYVDGAGGLHVTQFVSVAVTIGTSAANTLTVVNGTAAQTIVWEYTLLHLLV